MIYQPRVNSVSFKRKRFFFASLFVVLLLLGLFEFSPLRKPITEFAHILLAPIQALRAVVSEKGVELFTSKKDLLEENDTLREKLATQEIRIGENEILRKENAELKAVFGRIDTERLLLGRILEKPNRSLYDTLLIDVGLRDSVKPLMYVRAYGESPIGVVAESYEHTSLIRLFSSPGQETAVEVGEKKVGGTAFGIGGGNFRMLLPKDVEVALGDTVTLPGEKTRIIGIVERIDKSEEETFAKIFFKSIVNIYELSNVFIVIGE